MDRSNHKPRVTWLLPILNGMPFLERTLDSIARQTYRDFEITAWDNGSTDGTVDVLRRWIPHRLPGRVVIDRPSSQGTCLAAMIREARSPYCARIDADDVNEPTRLEEQIAMLDAHPRVAIVGSSMCYIDEHDRPLPQRHTPALGDADIRWRLRFCNALNHPTVTFRRDAVLDVGNYRDVVAIEDYELWLRLALKHQMINLPQPLVRYRVHASNSNRVFHGRWQAIRRQAINEYGHDLFPGLDGILRMRLYDLLCDTDRFDVQFSDCLNLRRTAGLAAARIGQRADYFHNTALFRIQMKSLMGRWIKSKPVIGHTWRLLRRQRMGRAA